MPISKEDLSELKEKLVSLLDELNDSVGSFSPHLKECLDKVDKELTLDFICDNINCISAEEIYKNVDEDIKNELLYEVSYMPGVYLFQTETVMDEIILDEFANNNQNLYVEGYVY